MAEEEASAVAAMTRDGDNGNSNSNSGNDNDKNGGGSGSGGGGRRVMAAWCGAGVRRSEAVEMAIKQKRDQCGYDRWKF